MYQPTDQSSWNRSQLYPPQPERIPQQYTPHPRSHAQTLQYNQRPGLYGYQTEQTAATASMKPAEMQPRGPTDRPQSQWDNPQGIPSQYSYDQRKMYPDYQKNYAQPDYPMRYPSMNNMNTNVMSEDPAQRHLQRSALPGKDILLSYHELVLFYQSSLNTVGLYISHFNASLF